MKKALLLLLICTAACTSANETGSDHLEPIIQNTFVTGYYANYQDGLFFVDMADFSLNYLEHLDQKVYVTDLRYCDDYPFSQKEKFENYMDSIASSSIYVYGGKIYYVAQYMNVEGEVSFKLYRLSLDGKNRKEIIAFKYEPTYFIIQNNRILTVEVISPVESEIHMYQMNGKEMNSFRIPGIAYSFFTDDNTVFFSSENSSAAVSTVYKMELNSFTYESLFNGKDFTFVYADDQKMAYYTLNHKFTDTSAEDEIVFYSKIYDFKKNSDIFAIQDEIINYFDSDYIYTSVLKSEAMVYHIYDWSGIMMKEISPSADLKTSVSVPSLFGNTDASQILRIIDNNIVGYTLDDLYSQHFFKCSINSGACRVIGEQNG